MAAASSSSSSSSSRKGDYHHDLLKKNIFSHEVRDQLRCNACWAIVGAATSSALYNSDQNHKDQSEAQPHVEASPQELVDRLHVEYRPTKAKHIDKAGCITSSVNKAYDYMREFGLAMESEFPFLAKRECCENNLPPLSETNPRLFIGGHVKAENKSHEEIEAILEHRPIAGALEITPELKSFVGEQIFQGKFVNDEQKRNYEKDQNLKKKAGKVLDGKNEPQYHAVMIIGYGRRNGVYYYVIKNSWGKKWGQRGYALVRRDLFDPDDISWPVEARLGVLVKKPEV